MAETLGRALLELDTDDKRFGEGVDRAHGKAGGLGREFERVGKVAIAAFAAMAAGAAVLVKQQINAADSLHKMAQSAGLSTQKFSEYDAVAKLSNVSTEALTTSLGRLSRNILDTAAGTGESLEGFKALGIEVKSADGSLKGADQIMSEVADKFAGMEDGAGKTALAMMLFGRAGQQMIPMLNEGSAGMNKIRDAAVAFGATIDSETGQAAQRFNDNIELLNLAKKGLVNTVMREVLPSLNSLTDSMVESAKNTGALKTAADVAATGLRILATGGTLLVTIFKVAGDRIGAMAASMGALLQGELAQAWQIQKDSVNDFVETTRSAAATILDIWDTSAQAAAAAANALGEAVKKIQAPQLANKEALAQAAKEQQAFLDLMAQGAAKRQQMEDEAEARATEKHQREIEALQAHMERISLSLFTEEEMEREKHVRDLEALILANEARLITDGEMMATRELMESAHMERLKNIRKKGMTDIEKILSMSSSEQTNLVVSAGIETLAAYGAINDKFAAAARVAGATQAFIATLVGSAEALKLGWPMGIIAALHIAAKGFALVAAIKSVKTGGATAAIGPLGTLGVPPATPFTTVTTGVPEPAVSRGRAAAAPPPQNVHITLVGGLFSAQQVSDLIDQINEMQSYGRTIDVHTG